MSNTQDLKDRLYNPLRYMEKSKYLTERKKTIRISRICLLLGGLCWLHEIFIASEGSASDHNKARAGSFAILLGCIVLPLLALYIRMTLDRSIANDERTELIWLHPELKTVEAERKKVQNDSKLPEIVILSIIGFIVSVGLVTWTYSLYQFAVNPY